MDSQKVKFTYPEGFVEAAESLTFLPDSETRTLYLTIMMSTLLML